jgi:hypothetical protein
MAGNSWEKMAKKGSKVKLTDTLKERIRIEYVHGIESDTGERTIPTLDELITKHGIPKTTLYRTSSTEGWKAQRERFQYEYMARLDEERTKNLVEESKKLDNTSINLAKLLMATVGQQMRRNSQEMMEGKGGLNASQVLSLSNAALSAQRLAKLALGEATQTINLNANFKDNSAFREAMELLDSVADQRRQGGDSAIH